MYLMYSAISLILAQWLNLETSVDTRNIEFWFTDTISPPYHVFSVLVYGAYSIVVKLLPDSNLKNVQQ